MQCATMIFFFLQNQRVFIVKAYYESWLYKFVREQFIAEFSNQELSTESSVSCLIQKIMTTYSVFSAM